MCPGQYPRIIVLIGIGGRPIQRVRHSTGKLRSAFCLPVTLRHWNLFQLRSRYAGNPPPVPYREYLLILISFTDNIGTSVRQEISPQIFPVAILTPHGPGRNHPHIKRIGRTHMQRVITNRIMSMKRSNTHIRRQSSFQASDDFPIFICMSRIQFHHPAGKKSSG